MYLKILLLSICFAGTICPSFAQQKDVIDILHADTYRREQVWYQHARHG